MRHVDALSRNAVVTMIETGITARIKAAQRDDFNSNTLMKALELKHDNDYTFNGGVLCRYVDGRELLMIPDLMQNEIIQTVHYKGHVSA